MVLKIKRQFRFYFLNKKSPEQECSGP